MSADDLHRWTRSRLAARRAGLLHEAEERRLDEHLSSCERCRAAAEVEAPEAGDDVPSLPRAPDGHIPASVLATWTHARANLKGLERAMVREHLERCAECRQDLEVLGHAPALEPVPALELREALARTVPEPAESRTKGAPASDRMVIIKLARPRRDWTRWAFGSWAAVATAAAFLLVANPGMMNRGGEDLPSGGPAAPPAVAPPVPGPPEAPPAVAPVAPTWTLTRVERPLRLQAALRAETVQVPERVLDPGTTMLPIVLEPLPLPDTSRVEVTIGREGGPPLVHTTIANRDLPTGRLLLAVEHGALKPGTYVVRMRAGPGPDSILQEPEEAEYRFVLKAAAAKR